MSSVVRSSGNWALASIRGLVVFCEGGGVSCWGSGGLVLSRVKRCRGSHLQGPGGGCRRLAECRIVADGERVRQKACLACCRCATPAKNGNTRMAVRVISRRAAAETTPEAALLRVYYNNYGQPREPRRP